MAQVKQLFTNATAVGAGQQHTLHPEESNRGLTCGIGGIAGAVAAVVQYQVSNDGGLNWATRATFNLSGTATLTVPVSDTDVDPNGPYPLVRGNIVSMTAGAVVNMGVCAARSGAGVA